MIRAHLASSFIIGDKVEVDGDQSLIATVTGVWFQSAEFYRVECSWLHNGANQQAWIEPKRLTLRKSTA